MYICKLQNVHIVHLNCTSLLLVCIRSEDINSLIYFLFVFLVLVIHLSKNFDFGGFIPEIQKYIIRSILFN